MSKHVVLERVSKWYPVKGASLFKKQAPQVKALDDVSLSLERGEILGVIGESGCGKSTLGRLLVRLEEPTHGAVYFQGNNAGDLLRTDPKAFRRMVQIVFQNPYDSFTPRDTIEKILLRPLVIHGIGENREERQRIITESLERGGLIPAKDYLDRYPHQLSGGQLQRIAILRAMLLNPSIIVADEPVSMLDVSVRADIINMLSALARDQQAAILFISHDISLTRYLCDSIAVMYLGRVVEYGPAKELVDHPQHPYTQVLISHSGSLDPREHSERILIEGEPPTPIDPGPGCYFAPRCPRAVEDCFTHYPKTREITKGHTAACDRIEI